MAELSIGPWEAGLHEGTSGARYFAVSRVNPKFWGHVEHMLNGLHSPRRFGSLKAAAQVAKAANDKIAAAALAAAETKTGGPRG